MPTNNHAQIRYQALDKCFRNHHKRFFIKDLIKACNDALYDYTGNSRFLYETYMNDEDYSGIKKRQIYSDINYMMSDAGFAAPIDKARAPEGVYYFYSDKDFTINSKPLTDDETSQLKETIIMLNRFKGMPQFEWMEELIYKLEDKFDLKGEHVNIIGFQENKDVKGLEYLSPLFNAIINKQVLHIIYRTFDDVVYDWIIHPYFIKQYNNRWFLLGLNNEFQSISNLPLDRIELMEPASVDYIPNTDIDFNEEYFTDIIGVNVPRDKNIHKVVLHFEPHRFNYVVTKPIHDTQRAKDGRVEIRVKFNKELESLLLSFGPDVEVIEPKWLRKRIAEKIFLMNKKYESVHIDCTLPK